MKRCYEGINMHVSATDLKNKLGQYLEASIKEPVIVEKSGRPTSVVISYEEYQKLMELEDELWGLRAKAAEKRGFLGVKETTKLLKQLEKKIANADKDD
jgi:antitoxin Phd